MTRNFRTARDQADYHLRLFGAVAQSDPTRALLKNVDLMGHFGVEGCQLVVDAFIASITSPPPWHLLELGSGFGASARSVADLLGDPGTRIVGVEIVKEMAEHAGRLAHGRHGHLPVTASADALPFASSRFDGVFVVGSFSHFTNRPLVVAEAARVTRPGGVVTFIDEIGSRSGQLGESFRAHHPDNVFPIGSTEDYSGTLQRAGMSVSSVDLSGWATTNLRNRARAMKLYHSQAVAFYGQNEAEQLAATIEAARDEVIAGRVHPRHYVAHRPCSEAQT